MGRGIGSGAGAGSAIGGGMGDVIGGIPPSPCCVKGGAGIGWIVGGGGKADGPGAAEAPPEARAKADEGGGGGGVGRVDGIDDDGGGGGGGWGAVRPSRVALFFAIAGGGVPAAGMGAEFGLAPACDGSSPLSKMCVASSSSSQSMSTAGFGAVTAEFALAGPAEAETGGFDAAGAELGAGTGRGCVLGGGATTGGSDPRPGGGGGVRPPTDGGAAIGMFVGAVTPMSVRFDGSGKGTRMLGGGGGALRELGGGGGRDGVGGGPAFFPRPSKISRSEEPPLSFCVAIWLISRTCRAPTISSGPSRTSGNVRRMYCAICSRVATPSACAT